MAINDSKIVPTAGFGVDYENFNWAPNTSQTLQPYCIRQMRYGGQIVQVNCYCRTTAGTITADIGFAPVGGSKDAVTFVIGTTTTKFKLNGAIMAISPTIDANTGMPTIVQKGVTDNLAFSAAYTINTAAAAGQFWGTVVVQMNASGTISTKAYATNQVFLSKADSQAAAAGVLVDAGNIRLGTISVQSGSGVAFTFGTTALTGGGVTVSYDGIAASFVSALTTPLVPVAASMTQGVLLANLATRTGIQTTNYGLLRLAQQQPGTLLVGTYTTDGSGAVADAFINVSVRPFPMNGEDKVNPLGA